MQKFLSTMSTMSMTQSHRKVLEKVAPDLLNDLDSEDILAYLVADEALSTDDVEKIRSKSTRKEKVSALLDILPRRGDGAYISLQSSLNKTDGSNHLYETMKKHEGWILDELQRQLEEEKPLNQGLQPKNPTKVLKDPDLLDLAQELGEHWEMLALKLGLTRAVIYQCKENNKYNIQSQIFDMLSKWKCSQGKMATVSAMLESCKKIKMLGEDAYEFLYYL